MAVEAKAVRNQTRPPGPAPKLDPEYHYVLAQVGWNGGENEPYDDLMNELSPTNHGDLKYEDLGHQPGIGKSRNQHVLRCSKEDYMASLISSARESEQSASTDAQLTPNARMSVERTGPRTLTQLGATVQDPD